MDGIRRPRDNEPDVGPGDGVLLLYPHRNREAVFCPRCGAQNADGAAFCYSCGNKLDTSLTSSVPSAQGQGMPSSVSVQGKNAVVAAILNLFFGLGYLYLGYKKVLGVPAIVFVVLVLVIYFVVGLFTIGIVPFILAIMLAVDGWQKGSGQKGFISAE
jgi:zinc ribbon protein